MMSHTTNKMWLGTELYSGRFGQKYTSSDFKGVIDYCANIGVDKIDTAECYGIDPSVEKMLGDALLGKRNKFIIATKFGHLNGQNVYQFYEKGQKVDIKKQLEASLSKLKTDFIDIYYFHSGDNEVFINDELWDFLNKKKDSGVIGELGLSLKHSIVMDKDNRQIDKAKDYGITIVQTVLNFFSRQSLDYVIPFCKHNGIKVLGRMPLAKGLLSGKYTNDHQFEDTDQRSIDRSLTEKIISSHKGITVGEALRWSSKYVDEIVIGSKNRQQIMENFSLINQ